MTDAEHIAEAKRVREKWSDLIFAVRRSIRYHNRRRKFFDALGVWADFLIIISAGTAGAFAIGEPLRNNWTIVLSGIIAVIGTLDLVIGFSNKARDYHDLVKDFSSLEREMTAARDAKTQENLSKFIIRRLEIQDEEPPILRVLNNYCHNELCRATEKDRKYYMRIYWFQSWLKQWCDAFPSLMKSYGSIEEAKEKKNAAKAALRNNPAQTTVSS
jgi:hypothetical protein